MAKTKRAKAKSKDRGQRQRAKAKGKGQRQGQRQRVSEREHKSSRHKASKRWVTPKKHRLGEIYTVYNDEKIKAEKTVHKKVR